MHHPGPAGVHRRPPGSARACRVASCCGRVVGVAPAMSQLLLPYRSLMPRAPARPAAPQRPAAPRAVSAPLLHALRALLLPAPPTPAYACPPRPLAQRPAPCAPNALRAQRPVRPAPCASSHNTILYCDTIWPSAAIPATIQFYCIAIQIGLAYVAIHLSPLNCIAIQFLSHYTHLAIQSHNLLHNSCNTNLPLAIQTFLLQYNFPSSQYHLGSSPKTVLH